jgi:hypothetical protein
MRSLRHRLFLGPTALLLAAIFFANQAFACCYAHAGLLRNLAVHQAGAATTGPAESKLPAAAAAAPAASEAGHACCHRGAADPADGPGSGNAADTGDHPDCSGGACILKNGSAPTPQLASVAADLPYLTPALAFLALIPETPVRSPSVSAPRLDTGPPVYLRTLRLLV